jgi:hypothetical protein
MVMEWLRVSTGNFYATGQVQANVYLLLILLELADLLDEFTSLGD